MNRRTFLVALAAGSGALVACQPIAAPATPDRGSVLLVDNGGEAAPLRLGLVQPAWTPVRLSLDGIAIDSRLVSTADAQTYADAIADLVRGGANAIVATGDSFGAVVEAAADSYAATRFLALGQTFGRPRPNLGALALPTDQLGFVAGALAALVSEHHVVGAALGPAAQPTVARMADGFIAGAQYVDSSVDAEIDNDGNDLPKGYQDPAGGREAAGRLFAKGVDVIFAAGGVTADGALAASQDQGVLAIAGERSLDAAVASPTTLLAAVDYVLDPAIVVTYVQQLRAGKLPDDASLTLRFSPTGSPRLTTEVRDRMNKLIADLRAGTIKASA